MPTPINAIPRGQLQVKETHDDVGCRFCEAEEEAPEHLLANQPEGRRRALIPVWLPKSAIVRL